MTRTCQKLNNIVFYSEPVKLRSKLADLEHRLMSQDESFIREKIVRSFQFALYEPFLYS